ncbi:hypothetical protein, partial [Trueperella pyogenes]|uniref:hypothetical protein n=1 Tax=Trueperella pyogenes TaxID=1661 RepID=UPI001F1667A0
MKKAINPTNETDYALLARNAGFSDVATMGQLLGFSSEYSRIRPTFCLLTPINPARRKQRPRSTSDKKWRGGP